VVANPTPIDVRFTLPAVPAGRCWTLAVDTRGAGGTFAFRRGACPRISPEAADLLVAPGAVRILVAAE